MTIHPLALLLICTICTAIGYLIGKITQARKAVQTVIDICNWD